MVTLPRVLAWNGFVLAVEARFFRVAFKLELRASIASPLRSCLYGRELGRGSLVALSLTTSTYMSSKHITGPDQFKCEMPALD